MKINKKICITATKQDFYSFKLSTVDKVHAVIGLWTTTMIMPIWTLCCDFHRSESVICDMIYFLIGLHCRLQLHWVTSEWSCLIASHCIYHSWALCRCHFCRFAQLSRLLTWQLVLLQLRDRPSGSKSCRQAKQFVFITRQQEMFSWLSTDSLNDDCGKAIKHRLLSTPCFKKTSTHIIGYKLRNSCPILIIFDTKISHIIWDRMTA